MKSGIEEKAYQAKLRAISDETFDLAMRCNLNEEETLAKYKIVMESKTEEEMAERLKALLALRLEKEDD